MSLYHTCILSKFKEGLESWSSCELRCLLRGVDLSEDDLAGDREEQSVLVGVPTLAARVRGEFLASEESKAQISSSSEEISSATNCLFKELVAASGLEVKEGRKTLSSLVEAALHCEVT